LSTVLSNPKTQWETRTVKWYGGTERKLEIAISTALRVTDLKIVPGQAEWLREKLNFWHNIITSS